MEGICRHIREGGVVVYPTDTLYGLGADPFNEEAVMKVFRLKRMEPRVLSVAFPDISTAGDFADIPEVMKEIFPAPVTVIARARYEWRHITRNGRMAVRIPDNRSALELLGECGPLTATSANIHGGPNLSLREIKETFGGDIPIIEGEEPRYMEASTIIDIVDKKIIREGAYPSDKLMGILREIKG